MKASATLLLALTALLPGCALGWIKAGHPLDPGALQQVTLGQTKADVLEKLGPPDKVSVERDESTFEYLFTDEASREVSLSFLQASASYDDVVAKSDRLVIRFDETGHVRNQSLLRQTALE
ncbi:MAG: outer membrane protein assembly factor BamE domain-containing protein [Planctomycetota bacterium]